MRLLAFVPALCGVFFLCDLAFAQDPKQAKDNPSPSSVLISEERSHPASFLNESNGGAAARVSYRLHHPDSQALDDAIQNVVGAPKDKGCGEEDLAGLRRDLRIVTQSIYDAAREDGMPQPDAPFKIMNATAGLRLRDSVTAYNAALAYSSLPDGFELTARYVNVNIKDAQAVEGYGVGARRELDSWNRSLTKAIVEYVTVYSHKSDKYSFAIRLLRDSGNRPKTYWNMLTIDAARNLRSAIKNLYGDKPDELAALEHARVTYARVIRELRYSLVLDYSNFSRIESVSSVGLSVSKLWDVRQRRHSTPHGLHLYGSLLPTWINRRYQSATPTSLILRETIGVSLQDYISVPNKQRDDAVIQRWHVRGGLEYTPPNGLDEGDTIALHLKYRDYGRAYTEYTISAGKGADDHLFLGFNVGFSFH